MADDVQVAVGRVYFDGNGTGEERIERGEFFKNTVGIQQLPYAALLVGAVFQVCNVIEAMHENGKGEGINC